MKIKINRMKTFGTLFIALCLFADKSYAVDFEITRLVEVGPVTLMIGGSNPIKFSPSGDKLGYFLGQTFMISDTLGETKEVITLEMRPISWDWLSNDEILLIEYKSSGGPSDYRRLSNVDVNTSAMEFLHEHRRGPSGFKQTTDPIWGLFRTLESNLSYRIGTSAGPISKFPESKYNRVIQRSALAEDHFLDWGKDGLYKISPDFKDSIRLGPFFGGHRAFPPTINSDLSYAVSTTEIIKISDSSIVNLPMYFDKPSGYIGCTFYWAVFSPNGDEILFDWLCSGYDESGGEIELDRFGLFDIQTGKVTELDKYLGFENCRAPIFSPDGTKIAFASNFSLYIVYREVQKIDS